MRWSGMPAEPAQVGGCLYAEAPGTGFWAFVGMLLVMAGVMVGLGLTG